MNNEEYQELTGRTECDYALVLENLRTRPEIIQQLRACYLLSQVFGEQMSNLKKSLFYCKQTKENAIQYAVMEGDDRLAAFERLAANDCEMLKILHGPIGLCTEADELFQMTARSILTGEPFDTVNAIEESGDVTWYLGRIFARLKTTFGKVFTININKLNARYPEKFTIEACENRDLDAERELLENAVVDEELQKLLSSPGMTISTTPGVSLCDKKALLKLLQLEKQAA